MRESNKISQKQSHTLDCNPKASRQAPISEILQAYKNGTLGRRAVQFERVGDEEFLQGKFNITQRENIDEDELLQGKFESVPETERESIQREDRSNNTGLPDDLKAGVENLSGYSMDDVRVHYNSNRPVQLQALAYTQGTDIHVAPGQEKHLPHEAWHVVQQKQGRVQPTMQLQGIHVNDNEGLEKEADILGEECLKFSTVCKKNNADSQKQPIINKSRTVQRTPLSKYEEIQLQEYLETANRIEADYQKTVEDAKGIESVALCSIPELKKFQSQLSDTFSHYDLYFSELNEKKRNAHLSRKAFDNFKRFLNEYTHSGGQNKLINLKASMKRLPKENNEVVIIPPIMRLVDYRFLLGKLHGQIDFQCGKMYPLPNIIQLKSDLETLMDKVKEADTHDWKSINKLHHTIAEGIRAYSSWNSAIKKQFMELKIVDHKSKMRRDLLDKIGLLNVASRSDESEGFYMRSQDVHKMHIGTVNPFAERMGPFLGEGAKIYNIGGAKMVADDVMVQSELRPGRRKVHSQEFKRLRDDILKHKNEYVDYIVRHLGECRHLKAPLAQLTAKYPCVMILFKDDLMQKVNDSQENIPEFLTHLLAGHINAALAKQGLRPLVERRQSFGFMTPTITDVHSGVRLSLGVTPSESWCKAVIDGIKSADSDIDSFKDYKNVPADTVDKDPDFVIMNKFNRGTVLGAGHKLITKKLLSEADKKSISQSELNAIFGVKGGESIVREIQSTKKTNFTGQSVDEKSITLYNRLKSFYEKFIEISGGEVDKKDVDWGKVDPAEILQELMDEGVKAAYDDSENVVGLDESSDDEVEVEPSRTPSGMSALALPIASYSSIHKGRSIVYDTAPFSYFEIDSSWKKTFDIDRIERLGIRYPLVQKAFKGMAQGCFDQFAEDYIRKQTDLLFVQIKEMKLQGDNKEEEYREEYREYQKTETDSKKRTLKAKEVEAKIEEEKGLVQQNIDNKNQKIENIKKDLNLFFAEKKAKLVGNIETILNLMNKYMECKESNEGLEAAKENITSLLNGFKESVPDGFVCNAIVSAFNKYGFKEMDKSAHAKMESNVETAFVDVNPCMTSENQFDSGENLYHQTMKKYGKLRMIVVDVTSASQEQIMDLIALFQDQSVDRADKEIVPFLCIAKSGTKHDQLGLDISTMGSCHYVMHDSFSQDEKMKVEFDNIKAASRSLSKNTEPVLVKKIRRDLRKTARKVTPNKGTGEIVI